MNATEFQAHAQKVVGQLLEDLAADALIKDEAPVPELIARVKIVFNKNAVLLSIFVTAVAKLTALYPDDVRRELALLIGRQIQTSGRDFDSMRESLAVISQAARPA